MLVGSIWVDPGATARDPEDGDLTDLIVRDASDLDTATPGVYLIRYSVEDADGCVSRATRYVRVIALVATSDPTYLRQLCLRQVPMAAMTCEVGMHTHEKHLPNPAAFPACCLVASEMDAAACFCDERPPPSSRAQRHLFPGFAGVHTHGVRIQAQDRGRVHGRARVGDVLD